MAPMKLSVRTVTTYSMRAKMGKNARIAHFKIVSHVQMTYVRTAIMGYTLTHNIFIVVILTMVVP